MQPHRARRLDFWRDFVERLDVASGVPLFDEQDLVVQTLPLGRAGQPVLARSAAMEEMVMAEVAKVVDDFHAGTAKYDGLIYVMYELAAGVPTPLYIGMTEKFGKKGGNLSANIAGIRTGTMHPFARWGTTTPITWAT